VGEFLYIRVDLHEYWMFQFVSTIRKMMLYTALLFSNEAFKYAIVPSPMWKFKHVIWQWKRPLRKPRRGKLYSASMCVSKGLEAPKVSPSKQFLKAGRCMTTCGRAQYTITCGPFPDYCHCLVHIMNGTPR
jgi:hypothetical protein